MVRNRFLCKTNSQGITTIFAIVVMLLLFMASCGGDKKEVVDVAFDPEKTYTVRTTEVNTLISDSGITRYRLAAREWLIFGKAADPFWYFPEGFYVEKFDSTFHAEASVKADTAYFFDKRKLWKLINNVNVESLDGKKLQTSLLYWDQKEGTIYSDQDVRMEDGDQIIIGVGFKSRQDMSDYEVFEVKGEIPVSETPADSTAQSNVAVPASTGTEIKKPGFTPTVAKQDSVKGN